MWLTGLCTSWFVLMLTFRLCKQNPHHQKLLPHTDRNVIRNCVVALSHQALNLRTGGADWVKEVKMLKSLVVGAKKFIRYKFFKKKIIFLFKDSKFKWIYFWSLVEKIWFYKSWFNHRSWKTELWIELISTKYILLFITS